MFHFDASLEQSAYRNGHGSITYFLTTDIGIEADLGYLSVEDTEVNK
jgi:hypothetical protein